MLQLILHIIIISIICMIWGLPLFYWAEKNKNEEYWTSDGFGKILFLFFSGLLTLSLVSSWLILFAPLKFSLLLPATSILLLVILLGVRKKINFRLNHIKLPNKIKLILTVFVTAVILLLIILGTLIPSNEDTQLYHLQIIRWANEYGVVPGMANIYPRLGLGSNWFNLISFFYIPAISSDNFNYLNTTITIWGLLWLIYKFSYHLSGKEKSNSQLAFFYFLVTLYFLFDWQLLRDTANSTAYDFIVTVLTFFCLSYFAEKILFKTYDKRSIIFLFIAFSVLPFKLSGIFLFIFVILYLINQKNIKILIASLFIALITVTPILLKNHIATGYLLFPVTISFGSPDWQLPIEMTERFSDYIINANRYYNHQLGLIDSLNKTSFNWIPYWFNGILIKHKILLAFAFLSPLISLIFSSDIRLKKGVLQFFLGIFSMFIGWFFLSPDPRFGFGFLLFIAFLPLCLLLKKEVSIYIYQTVLILITIVICIYTFKKIQPILKSPSHFIKPMSIENPNYSTIFSGSLYFNYSEKNKNNWNNRCVFTPLPCICEENPYLIPRGKKVNDGFRMKTKPDSNFVRNYNY